ncbi:hypothetical protein FPSE_10303 [Fusarium pseudograminearum CS3096]|uniref:Uncharacterized protein n=1 Tax=Fusarium pseudograminearum (strain CS3096) TaxID=1028729 RepID=K3VB79_FUSPC|nr:hypothetical protein FPSE_10303 [Fusarium pseudograminearum CS3096]EKJ69523.1 hypothetical protein FPSE_10303 [Fusarium pseudograminearum CS3096]
MTLPSFKELLAQLSIIPIPSDSDFTVSTISNTIYHVGQLLIRSASLKLLLSSTFTLATAAAPLTGSGASDVNTNANTSAASSLSKHSSCADTSGNDDISEYPLAKPSPSSLNSRFQSCIQLEASGTVFDKTEKRRDYEKAKKNFNQQWKRLKDKLHARADSATKKSLGEAAFDEHSEKYKSLGRHPDQLLPGESSQSQSQANQVDEDDGNPDWETDDELNELDRICESLNFGESVEQMKIKSQDEIVAVWKPYLQEIVARRVMGNFSITTNFRSPAHVFTRLEMFVWYMTKLEKLKTPKPLNRFWRLKNGYFKLPQASGMSAFLLPSSQGSKITYPLAKKRRYKSPIWHYLPGPSFLWDHARIEQLGLFETALQHFDGPIMDTFRLLVGDFKPAELVNKREPWLELQVLNLFE